MHKKRISVLLVLALLVTGLFTLPVFADPADSEDVALKLDPSTAEKLTVTVDGESLSVDKYVVTYVANPVNVTHNQSGLEVADSNIYQKMAIYVPENAVDKSAIIMQVANGGWNPSALNSSSVAFDGATFDTTVTNPNKNGVAFKNGYVVVSVGTRSRGLQERDSADNIKYVGKSPAVVVDSKAAIRYLRLNDDVLPGSAERIVITGTSGGGGLSAAVAASGNAPEYYSYLKEIGAAGIASDGSSTLNDDVFATIAYCPINDLDNADMAYEWTYNQVRQLGNADPAATDAEKYAAAFTTNYASGTDVSFDQMMGMSNDLKTAYSTYLSGLDLKDEDGNKITADNMAGLIEKELIREIEETYQQIQNGIAQDSLTNAAYTWFTLDGNGKVTSFDYFGYLKYVASMSRLKAPPAFDGIAHGTAQNETNLWGPNNTVYMNGSEYAWDTNPKAGDDSGLDDLGMTFKEYIKTAAGSELVLQTKMINPIPYLISNEGDSAPYWYVRHGARDRDTSFATQIQLKYAMENDSTIKDANFQLAWMKPHSGDYDVVEAYAWLAGVLEEANQTAVYVSGDNPVTAGITADYTVAVTNVEKFATATVWIEVDGSFVAGNGFEGLNGFQIIGSSDWTHKSGDIWEARLTLVNLEDSITSIAPVDILGMSLIVRDKLGESDISITDVQLSGYDESDQPVFIDTNIESPFKLNVVQTFSVYDVNRDGTVDQLDLTLAQLFYAAEEGDSNWDKAKYADVNSDGVVDIADFVLILNNIVW